MAKIQLAMCVYNKEKYVAQAIQSVIDQTFQDWTLTVLLNAPTDASAEIVNSFNDSRIVVINSIENIGQAAGLYTILKDAPRSEYVGWIDADDFMHQRCLELCYSANQAFVYTAYQEVNEDGAIIRRGQNNEWPYHPTKLLVQFICHHFRLISWELYHSVGGVDPCCKMAMDYDLVLKLSEVAYPHKLNEVLYYYRQHDDSYGAQNRVAQSHWAATAIRKAIKRRGHNT
jgi:glycosyltransferase involved in cell wall biosynthesis